MAQTESEKSNKVLNKLNSFHHLLHDESRINYKKRGGRHSRAEGNLRLSHYITASHWMISFSSHRKPANLSGRLYHNWMRMIYRQAGRGMKGELPPLPPSASRWDSGLVYQHHGAQPGIIPHIKFLFWTEDYGCISVYSSTTYTATTTANSSYSSIVVAAVIIYSR